MFEQVIEKIIKNSKTNKDILIEDSKKLIVKDMIK